MLQFNLLYVLRAHRILLCEVTPLRSTRHTEKNILFLCLSVYSNDVVPFFFILFHKHFYITFKWYGFISHFQQKIPVLYLI